MKRIFTIILMVQSLLLVPIAHAQTYWNGTADKEFSGMGTEAAPYLITTAEELAGLAARVNDDKEDFAGKYLKLTQDIYLTDFSNPDTTAWLEWEPIGHTLMQHDKPTDYGYFRGNFDGAGHTVYNMYYGRGMNWADDWDPNDFELNLGDYDFSVINKALFGNLDAGIIENLNISNAKMSAVQQALFVCNVSNGAMVRNCHVQGDIRATQANMSGFVYQNSGLIENCSANITANLQGAFGFAEWNEATGIIRNCTTSGTIRCTMNDGAGFVGTNKGLIEQCTSNVYLSALGGTNVQGKYGYRNGAGFVLTNHGIIRECGALGDLAAEGSYENSIIASFALNNYDGHIESCYAWGNLYDVSDSTRVGGNPQLVSFCRSNGESATHDGEHVYTGSIVNCYTTSAMYHHDPNYYRNNIYAFAALYHTSSQGFDAFAQQPSVFLGCFFSNDGMPSISNKSVAKWHGHGVSIAHMKSQSFVDSLNLLANFYGSSQWEYVEGEFPRPTGVRTKNTAAMLGGGDGTKENPYLISTKEQLINFRWLVNHGCTFQNEYVVQTANIALNAPRAEWEYEAPTKWHTIGGKRTHPFYDSNVAVTEKFAGTYDGRFHEIQNMYISNSLEYQGLFGWLEEHASIRNLGVTDAYVKAYSNIGILAGYLSRNTTIIQCWTSGEVLRNYSYGTIGALVGYREQYDHILNCYSTAKLEGGANENAGATDALGAYAFSTKQDTIINYLFAGVLNNRKSGYLARHTSYDENVFIDSIAIEEITSRPYNPLRKTEWLQSKEYVNLLNYTVTRWNAQHDEELHMHYWQWQEGKYPQITKDAKWHPAITIQFNSNGGEVVYPKYAEAGSIVLPPRRPAKDGYLFAGWYKDAECKQFFDFANDTITQDITLYARWIEDTRFDIDITPFQNEFTTTYRIRTAAQLRGLIAMNDGWWDWGEKVECSTGYSNTHTASYPNQALSQVYTPMDFEGKKVVLENDIFLCDTTDWQYWGRGAYGVPWKPIGNAHGANAGEGSHPFKGTFDGQGHTIYGMFIERSGMPGPDGGGSVSSNGGGAGLFGKTASTAIIQNLGIAASVIDLQSHDTDGQNGDAYKPFRKCDSDTRRMVSSFGLLIGGDFNCTVKQCFAKGNIYMEDCSKAGGLVSGEMQTTSNGVVENSYAHVNIYEIHEPKYAAPFIGDVQTTSVGGLMGSDGTIINSYAAGKTDNGAVATGSGTTVTNTYYDKQVNGKEKGAGNGKTTNEMHAKSTFAGFDFEIIWGRNDTINDGYPYLRCFYESSIPDSPDPIMVTGIEMEETVLNVIAGEQVQLHANVLPIDAQEKGIYWTITNTYTDVAEVDESGLVTTHFLQSRAGYTTTSYITATTVEGNFQKRCTLNVYHPSISVVAQKYFRRIDTPDWIYIASTSMNYVGWQTLMAITINPDSLHQAITFENSNPEVAQFEIISQDTTYNGKRCALGTLTCYTKGSTTLTIKHPNGYTCSRTFSVYQYDLKGISIHAPSTTMNVGETMQLSANTTPIYASTQPEGYMWSSSDESVLYVDYTGKLIAKKAGTATITLNSSNPSYTATILITVAAINPTSISIIPDRITIGIGETYQLTTSILPENATRDITWNMYNEWDTYTASVSKDGLVTGHAEGNVTVVATTINGLKAYCSVDVITKVTGVTLDNSSLEMQTGSTKYLTATVQPTNADNKEIVWSTTNENIAKVNAFGSTRCRITANNAGEAMVIVTTKEGNFSDTCLIIVSKPIVYYTVAFKDWNGTTLKTEQVEQGKSATAPADPVREGYTFIGWDKSFSNVQSDLTITAQYSKNIVYYTVIFVDWDGTELKTEEVEEGLSATAPADPMRKGYTFTGWDKDFSNVQSDLIVTAQYTKNTVYYTITFVNEDGTVLQTSQVAEGEIPVYTGETPTKATTVEYTYTFIGWTPELVRVTTDATYTATYTATKRKYQIHFLNYNGTELQLLQVEYGSVPEYTGETPTRPSTAQYNYVFDGWNPEIVSVTKDANYTATYVSFLRQYIVTFLDWDATVLNEQVVDFGSAAIAPAAPTREGYTFKGWDKDFSNVQSDLTVTAQYEKNPESAVEDIEAQENPVRKVMENQQLFIILPNGSKYSATGQKL